MAPTTVGRIASFYYLDHTTMDKFTRGLGPDLDVEEILQVGSSGRFSQGRSAKSSFHFSCSLPRCSTLHIPHLQVHISCPYARSFAPLRSTMSSLCATTRTRSMRPWRLAPASRWTRELSTTPTLKPTCCCRWMGVGGRGDMGGRVTGRSEVGMSTLIDPCRPKGPRKGNSHYGICLSPPSQRASIRRTCPGPRCPSLRSLPHTSTRRTCLGPRCPSRTTSRTPRASWITA